MFRNLCLQLDQLDDDTREMLQMLHDTCTEQSGVDEGMYLFYANSQINTL